ncbi:MAG: hypothetical protein AAF500_22145 [Myxococcota bacterium]
MSGNLLSLVRITAVVAVGMMAVGCSESAVGDPCVPEQVPEGGFLSSETYLETSSVQCATRVCLVRDLEGDPNIPCSENPDDPTCAPDDDIADNVYCSCRCGAPEGSSLPTCGCPGGFICEEILETGGDGLRGSYCVRDPVVAAEPNADAP